MLRIKEVRKELGLSQKDLADKLGVSSSNIYNYEIGRTEPSIDFLIKIAHILSVSVDYLIGNEDDFGVINNVNNSLLPDDEKELLYTYRSLSKQDKKKAINVIKTAFNK